MDLPLSDDVLITDSAIHVLNTGVYGPLPEGLFGLLIGRSSTTKNGLIIHVGVINSDYLVKIKVMVSTNTPPCFISKTEKIAQLLLLTFSIPAAKDTVRRTGGFGSTDVIHIHWTGSTNYE